MRVADIMTREVISVAKDESLEHVLAVMRKQGVTKVPVVEKGRLAGFVSDAEIADELGALKNRGLPTSSLYASSVMTRKLITVSPQDPVSHVVSLCRETGVPIVLVTEGNGTLAGVVTKSDLLPFVESKKPLRDFARRDVVSVTPEDRVVHARRIMLEHGIERLPVHDGGRVVGVIAEADIAFGLNDFKKRVPVNHQRAKLKEFLVREVMVPEVVTASPDMTAAEAARLMARTGVGCLPVVEHGRLAGLVTRTDLIGLIGEPQTA